MCLIKGEELSPCMHWICLMTYKYPEFYATNTKVDRINNRKDFNLYKIFRCKEGSAIIAVNPHDPGTEDWNEFEVFRQNWSELNAVGDWPQDRNIFKREEVSIQLEEYRRWSGVFSKDLNDIEKVYVTDLRDVVVYVGNQQQEKAIKKPSKRRFMLRRPQRLRLTKKSLEKTLKQAAERNTIKL